jgi:hypothetical protein
MRRGPGYPTSLGLIGLLLLAGCGGGDSREAANEEAPTGEAPAAEAASAPAPATQDAPLTVEDIARWEKGMAAELTAVKAAGARLAAAKTGEDTLSAVMDVQEMATTPIGAEAAGVDPDRYRALRSDLSAAVSYLTPHLGGIDTTLLSPAQREEMRKMNAAQLTTIAARVPPALVEALKPKAEALRKQDLELAGARLKSAGM